MTDRPVSSEELDEAEADVDGVEGALGRLDDGTYSTCEVCGAPIDADRLATDPIARTCAEHAG